MSDAEPERPHRRGGNTLLAALPWLWSLLAAAGLFGMLHGRGFDDPYITYRYAEMLAAGNGFVYNPGERVLSTTTPLYTLLLALLAMAGFDLPLASNAIGCLSMALGGLALWRLGQRWGEPLAGAAGLLLYPLSPLLAITLGAETAFYIALVLWGFVATASRRYTWAAVLLALAALTRADGVLAAAVAGVYVLAEHSRTANSEQRTANSEQGAGRKHVLCSLFSVPHDLFSVPHTLFSAPHALFCVLRSVVPWRALLLYLALLLPWFIFAWAYFGAPFPATLAAKQQQGRLLASQSFTTGLAVLLRRELWSSPSGYLSLALMAAGLGYALISPLRRRWLLLPAWNLVYAAAYATLGVTSYFWYYAPLAAGMSALAGLGVAAAAHAAAWLAARSRGPGRCVTLASRSAAMLLLLAALLLSSGGRLAWVAARNDNRMEIYRQAGAWLRDHTPADASVGTLEVGIIGYYAGRRMIDFAGLIQPDVARQLSPATTYEDAAIYAVARYRPDYLLLPQGMFPRLESDERVRAACHEQHAFTHDAYRHRLVVHACRW